MRNLKFGDVSVAVFLAALGICVVVAAGAGAAACVRCVITWSCG